MKFLISGKDETAVIRIENQKEEQGVVTFDVAVSYETPTIPEPVKISFSFPV